MHIRIALCLLIASSASAADWPEFRGATSQGHADGKLPVTWKGNVAWRQAIPGQGWSSPVIGSGKLFLTAAIQKGSGFALAAICLDPASGKGVWQQELFKQSSSAPRIHRKNSHASPTPIYADGKLYVHFGHMGTACLEAETGKVVWSKQVQYKPVHGNGGSPVLVDGLLFFSCDGGGRPFVIALDAKTGAQRWRKDRPTKPRRSFSFGTPLVIEHEGRKQIISQASDAVFSYDPASGKVLWRVDYPGGYSVVPRPVYGHGLLYVCTGFDKAKLLVIRPDGNGNVTRSHVVWSERRNVSLTPSPLLVGDELYLVDDNGVATCFDAKTGKVHWRERVGGKYSSSPLLADGKIYFQAEDGKSVIVEAGKRFKIVARNDLKERTLASYAVADGAIFIRTASHLYRIE